VLVRRTRLLRRADQAGRNVLTAAADTNDRTCRALIGEYLGPDELEQLSTLLGLLPSVRDDASACAAGS
jgi:hypothetical protein